MPPERDVMTSDHLLLVITLHKLGIFSVEVRPVAGGYDVCAGNLRVEVPMRPRHVNRARWANQAVETVIDDMGLMTPA